MPATHAHNRSNQFDSACAILDRHGRQPSKLIPILQAIQHEYRYLPEDVMNYVATAMAIPPARVFGVATFYTYFALEPKGKYVIRLCDGTACHVKESIPILEALRAELHVTEKRTTTPDGLFTVETVACVGACGLAPVVMVNDEVHSSMTPESAVKLIEAIQERELAGC
ncbi:MAG: NAD(P)H-dependent oxidoreductase subunit E [Vicinamibacterales bacterium]|nr:NAD(P)H-dependent oxidoreductase subunit E [Vicinamibacterales bacterium]